MIIESCLGLLQVDEGTSHVRLVHLTLQEYLQSVNLLGDGSLDAQSYATRILLTCLDLNRLTGSSGTFEASEDQTMFAYAVLNWGSHARSAAPSLIEAVALNYLRIDHTNEHWITGPVASALRTHKTLPEYAATILNRFPHQGTGLHIAASFGLSELVAALIEEGAALDVREANGNTALHLAIANGYESAATVLLGKGARVNSSNQQWRTPLYDAVAISHNGLVSTLLAHKAAVNEQCEDGWTSLHKAAYNGDLSIAKLLIANNASISALSARGLIPLHRAAGQGHLDIIDLLLDAGSPVDHRTIDGWSPLHGACSSGKHEATELLLNHQANVHLRSDGGQTPLHRACRNGHFQTALILLRHGAEVLCQTGRGELPFHRAVTCGHKPLCELLLRSSQDHVEAQLTAKKLGRKTPRELAAHYGHWHLVDMLRHMEQQCGILEPMSEVEVAIKRRDLPYLKQLHIKGVDLSQRTSDKLFPLHLAILQEDKAIADFLLKLPHSEPGSRTVDGWHAIHYAARRGNSPLLQLCLEHGAPVNARTPSDETPLHKACSEASLECVKILLNAGAKVNVRNDRGWTPLHTASAAGSRSIVELLIDNNADVAAKTLRNKSVQACAAEAGHDDLCQFWRQLRYARWPENSGFYQGGNFVEFDSLATKDAAGNCIKVVTKPPDWPLTLARQPGE